VERKSGDVASPLAKLRSLCLALPDTWEKISHGEPTFWVGKRMFASFANADNHHGSGRYAVWCNATHTTQHLLVSQSPDRYFVPPYVGVAGWVGIYLDRRPTWSEVAERLASSYELTAETQRTRRRREKAGTRRRRGAEAQR
jgi:predicted DNA-binding protein (MmcQ/YjbR family)